MKESARKFLNDYTVRYPELLPCRDTVFAAGEILAESFRIGGKLLVCGNGGSASDALHIVGELMKGFILPRRLPEELFQNCPDGAYLSKNLQDALPAVALVGETALTTAYSNDEAPDLIFAQQVYGYGRKGDALLCISTSGNSANVLYAAQTARVRGVSVLGLTGESGGKLAPLCDVCIKVPARKAHEVQEYHLPVYHALCLALEEEFFGKN